MPRSLAREQDILRHRPPKRPPRLTTRRIGIHTSSAGGVQNAAERAYRLGCNTFQIFSTSPRQWAPYELGEPQCAEMNRLRLQYGLKPLVIHTNYLVLHPGSFRGADREQGLLRTAAAIAASTQGLNLESGGLTILIENTAGSEFSLGGSFEQVSEVIDRLRGIVPVGACIDTCHTHVAGYDIISAERRELTLAHLDRTVGLKSVRVWHCNDAKAERGSRLDRHEHIGQGSIGIEPFRRLLNDPRFAHAAFIAETPADEEGDEERNVRALKSLVERT